jgi:hypothetical protein
MEVFWNSETQPLPTSIITACAFAHVLTQHHLTMLDLAQAAGVRLMVVWRALHGLPITASQAQSLRRALFDLTGVAYRGTLLTHGEEAE